MPPGARPTPTRGSAVPRKTSHTQAVAQGGSAGLRASIDARAQAASYGLTGQHQALRDLAGQIGSGQQGYSSHPGQSDAYTRWQQQQGFRPQNYEVAYGQTPEGKYSGFKNASDLKAAVIGSAELSREQDLAQAAHMKDDMSSRLAGLGQTVDTNMLGAGAALRDSRNRLPAGAPAGASDILGQRYSDYGSQLDDWYAKQGAPLVEGMETANQIASTPTREYEMRSGAEYGVDPNVVAGWFTMDDEIGDAADQRDLESLHDTGMPYSEQQTQLSRVASDQQTQQRQQADDDEQAMDDAVYGATTFGGRDLAQAASIPLQDAYDITTSPNFQGYAQNVQDAIGAAQQANPAYGQNGDAGDAADNEVAAALDEAIRSATDQIMSDTGDPNTAQVVERILRTLYGNI